MKRARIATVRSSERSAGGVSGGHLGTERIAASLRLLRSLPEDIEMADYDAARDGRKQYSSNTLRSLFGGWDRAKRYAQEWSGDPIDIDWYIGIQLLRREGFSDEEIARLLLRPLRDIRRLGK
jgi:hypothetical protein